MEIMICFITFIMSNHINFLKTKFVMSKFYYIIVFFVLSAMQINAQNGVSINHTGAASDPSAMLDVSSSNKGFLTPRMTEADRIAVVNPARGLLVYQIDNTTGFWFFDGSSWVQANAGDNLGNHIATDSLDMANKKITNLATCTHNLDAANKEYVDNAVGAGGGAGYSLPSMISNESLSDYTLSEAVDYCNNLSEGGFNDWRLPLFDEMSLFFGSDAGATEYLWTRTMAWGKENASNQHYVAARISDGKFRNAEELSSPVFSSVSGSTKSGTWVSLGSVTPSVPGNWLSITQIKLEGYSYWTTAYIRLKFNYSNGSSGYSPVYSYNGSTWLTFFDWTNIQSPLSLLSLDLECYSGNTSEWSYGRVSAIGYEVIPFQKDGNKLRTRCVR